MHLGYVTRISKGADSVSSIAELKKEKIKNDPFSKGRQ